MSKTELNISDKKLYNTTKEDMVLNPASRIPSKGVHDLISLKGINSSEIAYYDIALTELQGIINTDEISINAFIRYTEENDLRGDLDIKMGDII